MGSMRFRNLTEIELEALSEELVQFLIVQGIDGDLWLEMNQKSPQKAIELVSLFSDTVLEKVYSKVQHMSFLSTQIFSIFKIEGSVMQAVVVKNKATNKPFKNIEQLIDLTSASENETFEIMCATRELEDKILDEIHRLTEQGCLIADPKIWAHFAQYHKN